jgi:hypothetical protein
VSLAVVRDLVLILELDESGLETEKGLIAKRNVVPCK